MNQARRDRPSHADVASRRLTNTAGLALAVAMGAVLWGGLVEGAHLLGLF